MTLTSNDERLAVELSLPVFTTYVCRGRDSNTQPSACGTNALTDYATAAVNNFSNTMFCDFNIKSVLSNERKLLCTRLAKLILTLFARPENFISGGNHCTVFGKYPASCSKNITGRHLNEDQQFDVNIVT